MKMRSTLAALAAGTVLFAGAPALAQDLPDLPGLDAARDRVADRPAAAQSPQVPGAGVLPADARAGLGRAPAAAGTGSPSRLPETGVDTTALALDGLTLLGAGSLLLAARRRLAVR